jgi:glycosyltransferase involved in cell wall biosynthesis
MNFQIQDTTNLVAISQSARSLDVDKIDVLAKRARPILGRLSVNRFLFLMANLASQGSNFSNNLELIEDYFLYTANLDDRLIAEDSLHRLFVKKYETEETYNQFYGLMQKLYESDLPDNVCINTEVKHIIFFVHNPVFLAHTNVLFNLLQSKRNKDYKVTICSLRYDAKFAAKCKEVQAEFKVFNGSDLTTAYEKLIHFSKGSLALVWLSVPVHLAYISQRLNNIVLWTHKYHPNFSNLRGCIGDDSLERTKFSFFDKDWLHFDAGMKISNFGKKAKPFSTRKLQFASICREELIDDANHWKSVSVLLQNLPQMYYSYCGRVPIHDKWCDYYQIPPDRINFLGWIANPEEKLQEYLFLLDGTKLGHGLIAMEAIACGVPVLSPECSLGRFRAMLNWAKSKFQSSSYQVLSEVIFETDDQLLSVVRSLCDEERNDSIADLLIHFFELINGRAQTFDDFIHLLESLPKEAVKIKEIL